MAIEGVLLSTKKGKLLFYRNYAEISHSLFEDFSFSLPQKITIDSQHTFSNHGSHRLIYLPLDELLLVLVTTLDSNIIEDIETVGMMKDIVYSVLKQENNEDSVLEHYLDLTFSFDEMVNLQMRTCVTKSQIIALLEMDSNNEKLHNAMMLEREMKQKKKTEDEYRKLEKSKKIQGIIKNELKSIDQSMKDYSKKFGIDEKIEEVDFTEKYLQKKKESGIERKAPSKKGMKLGGTRKKKKANLSKMFDFKKNEKKKRKKSDVVEEIPQDKLEEEENQEFNPLGEELRISLVERMQGKINSSGEFKSFELKGDLKLFVLNPELGKFVIKTNYKKQKHINLKLPPNFDKKSWKKGILALKKTSGELQKQTLIETLKYSLSYADLESSVPFNFAFWFSGSEFSCELEFNEEQSLFKSLDNLEVHFTSITSSDSFETRDTENSTASTNSGYLVWKIPRLDEEESSASLILNFENKIEESDVFPAEVQIESESTLLGLFISEVVEESGRQVKFDFNRKLKSDELNIA